MTNDADRDERPPLTAVFSGGDDNLRRTVVEALTNAGLDFSVNNQEAADGSHAASGNPSLLIRCGSASGGSDRPIEASLFQAMIDSIDQGMVVFGPDLRITISNSRFVELAEYPEWLGRPGTSIADGLRYDAERGVHGPGDPEKIVAEMMADPRLREACVFERRLDSGRVIEIKRNPMPGGGMVAIHTDITERRAMEDALEQGQKRHRDLIEGSLQGVLIYRDFKPLHVNQAWAEIFGFETSAEVLALDSILPLFPEHEQRIYRTYAVARQRGEQSPSRYVTEAIRRDGMSIWLNNIVRVVDWEGEPAIMSTIVDITEQRQAEEELRQHRNHLAEMVTRRTNELRMVTDNVPALITYIDSERRYRVVNKTAELWLNQNVDQILGRTVREVIGDALVDQVASELDGGLAGRPQRFEKHVTYPDGVTRDVDISYLPESDADGAVIGIFTLAIDITERKRSEQALRASEAQLRLVTDALPAAIAYFNSSVRYRFVNKKAEQVWARPVSEILGKHMREVVGEENHRIFRPYYEAALAGKQQFFETEVRYMDGRTREVEISFVPHIGPDGAVLGFFGLAIDATERHELERRLAQAQKMEAVGQLTGGVAHDFNNLLTVILGNAELLSDKLGSDNPMTLAIRRASTRGAELTQRLLAFSRQQPLLPRAIDLSRLVAGISDLLERTLGETIEIVTTAAAGLWTALADPGQVENSLLNLAINARDAMPGGGKLTIACVNARLDEDFVARNSETVAGDYVVLAVTDTGGGMSAEVRAHAFEPFFTTKDVGQGSGLGLSMVYGFAKQSNGHVVIDSEVNVGTTVKLYLPVAVAAAPQRHQTDDEIPRGRGELVLVVEDDPDVRALTVNMLENLGYNVINTAHAAEARAVLAKGKKVDLVLSDVILPGGTSGPEFAAWARASYPDLKVIFMSGYSAAAAKDGSFLDAGKIFLRKPFQQRQLANALRQALD